MDKEILNIKQTAQFVLTESQYNEFMRYITKKAWNNARFFIADLLEELEINSIFSDDEDEVQFDIQGVQQLDNLLTDYLVNLNDEVDGGEQRKRIIRGVHTKEQST